MGFPAAAPSSLPGLHPELVNARLAWLPGSASSLLPALCEQCCPLELSEQSTGQAWPAMCLLNAALHTVATCFRSLSVLCTQPTMHTVELCTCLLVCCAHSSAQSLPCLAALLRPCPALLFCSVPALPFWAAGNGTDGIPALKKSHKGLT